MIGVVIVDDHALVRAGLAELLSATDDIEVVGTASDGETAVDLVAELSPQVVLMDLSMPGIGGIEAVRQIRSRTPDVAVVALTSFAESRPVLVVWLRSWSTRTSSSESVLRSSSPSSSPSWPRSGGGAPARSTVRGGSR